GDTGVVEAHGAVRGIGASALVFCSAGHAQVGITASRGFRRTRGSVVDGALDTPVFGAGWRLGGASFGALVVAGHTLTLAAQGAVVAVRGTRRVTVFHLIAGHAHPGSPASGFTGTDAVLVFRTSDGSGGAALVG